MADRRATRKDKRKATKRAESAAAPSGPQLTLTTGWAAVLIALLVVVFFHEVFLGGKTFVSPDATSPVGFVRMGEKALFEQGTYPLWNPFVFLGMPSFASGAYNPLIYPPDWPLWLVQKVVPLPELTWLLLYYALAGFFTFLLAREWGARAEGALLAGVVYVFAPNLVAVGAHGHGSQLVNSAYIPLMLWLASRWLRRGDLRDLGWLALAGGFQFLRGHVQICFYTWAAIGLLSAVDWIASLRVAAERIPRTLRVAAVLGAAALAFGIAGFYNLPLRDYAQYSIRGGGEDGGVGFEYATQWSMAPYELPALAIPGWTGFGGQTYWGGMPFTDYPNAFVGIVTLLLMIPAFLRNGPHRVFALILGAGALLIAFGSHSPLYGFLYDHLPLFNKFRVPVMVVVLWEIAAALGLAWGWSTLLGRNGEGERERGRLPRLVLVLGGIVGVVALAGLALQGSWRQGYIETAMSIRQGYPAELANLAYDEFIGDLLRAALLGLCALAVAWLVIRRKLTATLATIAILVLILVELWPVSSRVMRPVINPPVGDIMELGRDDVVDFLEKAGPMGTFRVYPLDRFQDNTLAGFGIASVGGYHAAKPRLVQDLIERQMISELAWMNLLNVRYIIAPQPFDDAPPFLTEVYRGSRVIYENMLALPRVTVVGSYEVVQPATAVFDSVQRGTADIRTTTYLTEDPGLALGPTEGATAEITAYGLNEVSVRVETPGPALLRLADAWYPDWRATVDGEDTPVLRADYLLRAVFVPAGTHDVVFTFVSPAVRAGLTLSIVSAAVVLLLLGAGWWQSRRRRTRSEPDASPPAGGAGAA